jgi:hypothetical protein
VLVLLEFYAHNFALVILHLCVYIYSTYSQDRTARAGQAEQHRQNRTGRTGQSEQDSQNRTGRKEQAKQDRQNRIGRTGKAEQDSQNGTAEQDCHDRNLRTFSPIFWLFSSGLFICSVQVEFLVFSASKL